MKTGVIGASGYSGELLVKLLANHPRVELAAVTSRQFAGETVESALPALRGRLKGLSFLPSNPEELAKRRDIDVFFLALPHGVAAQFVRPLLQAGKKVIDLSADFRLRSEERYAEFYGCEHPDPKLLEEAVYVLPELSPENWKTHSLIACPGCYPTSILLPLIPLLREKLIASKGVVINSFSGVSGAGKKSSGFYGFAERNENAVAYGIPKHRHLSEIEEQLSLAAGEAVIVQFSPHLAPMTRGIATTTTAAARAHSLEEIYEAWERVFAHAPFVSLLPSGVFPATGPLVGTNRIHISAVRDERTDNFIITSALDNLMKGAGGQAVQIMNRWFDYSEEAGLG